MFKSETSTDNWDLGITSDTVTIDRKILEAMREDCNILYALRKMGFVTAGQEAAAVEFLAEEGVDV
jgi:hypothetical protein